MIPDMIKLINPASGPGGDGGKADIARFVIVGSGPALEPLSAELEGRSDTLVAGRQMGEDLSRAYASSNIFFTPTTTGTADLVFFEAQGAGLCVVGPRCVAIPTVRLMV